MKILVMSCDKNEDIGYPFYHCIEKYGLEHPEVFYSTETKKNPYYKTICKEYDLQHGTKRIRETLEEIDDEYIITMVDDIFLQSPVDNNRIYDLLKYFDNNTACINLQPTGFDRQDIILDNNLCIRSFNGPYKISFMCGLWNRKKLINLLDYDTNPGQVEGDNKHKGYRYLITRYGDYLNGGFTNIHGKFGLHEGKYYKECVDFFKKEGLAINYKRGII